MREGELLALRWSDVDLEVGLVHARRNVQRLPQGLVLGPPKSTRSRRTIPLPATSVGVLRTHRARQAAEILALGPVWADLDLVFTSAVGTVIEPCASMRLAQGVPARVVMDVLGHSQLAVTTDLYSHVTPTAVREAADAMDRAWGRRK